MSPSPLFPPCVPQNRDQLTAENQSLRRLLNTLTADAAFNQEVMQRFHEREISILSAADLPQLLDRLTSGIRASFSLDAVCLVLLDPYGVLHELLVALGIDPASLPNLELRKDMQHLREQYPSLRHAWLGPCDPGQTRAFQNSRGIRSMAILPMRQPDGLSGFLHMGSRNSGRFKSGQATDFLQRLANVAAVCLENAVNRERLRLTGLTDGLTGLYNRRHLEHRLQEEVVRARRHRHHLSCLFIDADHFKTINDRYGHAVGDQVLIAIAKRIREQLRGSDLAARYGGEEIAVLLPQTDAENAAALAERIREHIAKTQVPVEEGQKVSATVSIGVAQLSCNPLEDPKVAARRLLEQADEQTYQAKHRGRNRVAMMTGK